MKTRSQTIYEENAPYKIYIDFDLSSKAWRENKIKNSGGTYKYKCTKICKNNNMCKLSCLDRQLYCKKHIK